MGADELAFLTHARLGSPAFTSTLPRVLSANKISKSHGARTLFKDVSIQLRPGRRVALLGGNGVGKTTLMEMLVGTQEPDTGEVIRPGSMRLGYLPQDLAAEQRGTVIEEAMRGAEHITKIQAQLSELEEQMGTATGSQADKVIARYGELQSQFEQLGGYAIEAEAHRVLAGLGFASGDASKKVGELSGGWRMRLALARLLLSAPDVLLLDEPTNPLDVDSVAWLESHLAGWTQSLLFVSHDRDFIDGVATHIIEVADGTAAEYTGSFLDFVVQREERIERLKAQAASQARKVAKTQDFIDRFRYKATKARQVQSRVKQLEKLEIINVTDRKEISARFAFPEPRRANRVVVQATQVAAGYDGEAVLRPFDITIERGRKVAIVGPNGAGKTTMIRTLLGEIPPIGGEVQVGSNVDIARFDQHQAEVLDQRKLVHEEFRSALPKGDPRNIRTVLGSFGFSGDAGDRLVGACSGGEQTRLALAKAMATPVNLLVLDEPTNHLDLPSCDLLEDALMAYPGTVLLVTHDRHLIRNVADAVIEVRDGQTRWHDGVAESVLEKPSAGSVTSAPKKSTAPSARARAKPKNKPKGPQPRPERQVAGPAPLPKLSNNESREMRKQLNKVERSWENAEAQVVVLSDKMADPAVYENADKIKALVAEHDAAKDSAAKLMTEWEALSTQLDLATG